VRREEPFSLGTPYERIFNSLVFATVAHSALISLAIARPY